ncbi:TonB-dependent receptor domain-containing protein [Phenylobacterium sp.]|uniref:TonB-dependent receptor plug domain-containing protein n=1 Tax=Phenylobacterium sp. TaxID=1871053 RepID=UPI00286AD2E4|nr:TonB-dependent receptor [Phenylobacterium sp.]
MTNKSKLLASSLLPSAALALLCAQPALAQTASRVDQVAVEELVVTGTRLRLQDYDAPNPATTLGSQALELSGTTNVAEFLTDIPALTASQDLSDGADTSSPDSAGLNLLNLRNLGTVRTLVLVDGRRHVGSDPGTASVDVNAIPVAMIDRVEILTGGASAVYGADGVSGVVNFILKKDFEGVDMRAQTGWTEDGGGSSQFVSALVGRNFASDRGNFMFGLEYAKDDPVKFNQRRYSRAGQRGILISNPDDPGTFNADADDPNIFDNILARDVRYIDTSPGGSVYTNFSTAPTTAGVSFLGDGQPFIEGRYAGGFFMIGGSGSRLDDFNDDLLPGLERITLSSRASFELNDNHRLFGEFKFTTSDTEFEAQPSYDYGLFISDENPFLPANVLADARTPGGLATPDGAAAFGLPTGVLVARDNFDLGKQRYEIERQTFRVVGGIEGDVSENIRYEASYVFGRAKQSSLAANVRLNDRYYAATDVVINPATGQPVCRSNLTPGAVPIGDVFGQFAFPSDAFGKGTFTPGPNSGCLPLNIFGEGRNSAEAVAWINGESEQNATIDQHVLNGFVTGDTTGLFELPAGPISFVAGLEYRKEKSDFRPSPLAVLGETLEYPISGVGRGVRTKGEFDVKEAFGEISVPLLRDVQFAKELTLSGAYRYSDYSTSGGTSTWNINGRWRPVQDIMFRATKAKAVRAPNIVNLFRGNEQTFGTFSDPCSVENLGQGENPTLRRQNCATTLTALGVDPSTFINNSSEAVGGFIAGNPDLAPEEADTFTVGLVFTPRFLSGFSFSIDYYDIEITDAIQSYESQTIVNNCYDLPQPNEFCDLVQRTAGGFNPGRLTSFQQVPGNIASYQTAGYDFTARYQLDPTEFGIQRNIGTFDFSVVGNKLDKLVFVETSGAEPDDDLGELEAPEWQVNLDVTWKWNDLLVNYGLNYFDKTLRYTQATLENEPDYVDPRYIRYDARMTHDIQVRYAVNDAWSVYGGINNFTNQEPEPDDYTYPVSPLGRLFYVGVRATLGGS